LLQRFDARAGAIGLFLAGLVLIRHRCYLLAMRLSTLIIKYRRQVFVQRHET
jgi:hypothetical protein